MGSRSRRQTRLLRLARGQDPTIHNEIVQLSKRVRQQDPADDPDDTILYYSRAGTRISRNEYLDLFEDPDYFTVCRDRVGDVLVSTIWLGIDHSWGTMRRPLIFETLVVGGDFDHRQERYCTEDRARCGHMEIMEQLLEAATP